MNHTQLPALEGWFTLTAKPALIGTQCTQCASYYFPKQNDFCRNPHCDSDSFREIELSRYGKIWSYTSAHYQPPAPFVNPSEPFQPFAIAAVELEKERMIILGQMSSGVCIKSLKIGTPVELILETLHETEQDGERVHKLIWKWQPLTASDSV